MKNPTTPTADLPQPWWSQPAHRWLANRETASSDAQACARLGSGDLVISLSGGADSTSVHLHLEETGFLEAWEQAGGRVVRIFMDTGWELPETYDYVDLLERRFGKIHRLATWVPGPGEEKPAGYDFMAPVWVTPGKVMDGDRWAMAKVLEARIGRYCPMVRLILQWGRVPTSVRRWCTADLKSRPATAFLATCDDPLNAIGVRAEESDKRARHPAFEWAADYDAHVWRPIKWWSKADRIAIHQRHGLAPNPLYLQGSGAGRVGCRVCVNSGKEDVMWLHAEQRESLDILADVEAMLAELPTAREEATGQSPRWFTLTMNGDQLQVPVAEAVRWAHTARGGKQYPLFRPVTDPGCSAWGLCDVSGRWDKEEEAAK